MTGYEITCDLCHDVYSDRQSWLDHLAEAHPETSPDDWEYSLPLTFGALVGPIQSTARLKQEDDR